MFAEAWLNSLKKQQLIDVLFNLEEKVDDSMSSLYLHIILLSLFDIDLLLWYWFEMKPSIHFF